MSRAARKVVLLGLRVSFIDDLWAKHLLDVCKLDRGGRGCTGSRELHNTDGKVELVRKAEGLKKRPFPIGRLFLSLFCAR